MNNNIQEPLCSYKVSKLLKEKGFDIDNKDWYYIIHNQTKGVEGDLNVGDLWKNTGAIVDKSPTFKSPSTPFVWLCII